jgi:hypothetical protein
MSEMHLMRLDRILNPSVPTTITIGLSIGFWLLILNPEFDGAGSQIAFPDTVVAVG